ncbi:hypothetical protein [Neolewinella antarctica]|uniref:Uncharacterized protein n=1 Tax=Neolewinella antarctica TaxID=442734 RepID=A0ABX0XA11_9BACT|nr:hypothetical protein [Neolewinella antarctica]NJC26065.1 hypothetical protein [Neolewinella antarctica]
MKYLLILPLLFATLAASAQIKTTVVTETETKKNYSFNVSVSRDQAPLLVAAYAKISGSDVIDGFRGDLETTTEDGILIALDNKSRELSIDYAGLVPETITRAEAMAATVREYLDSEETPTPPTPNDGNE